MVHKSDVLVYLHPPVRNCKTLCHIMCVCVCVCVCVCACACVCVCVSLHYIKETVILLNLTLFIYNFYT